MHKSEPVTLGALYSQQRVFSLMGCNFPDLSLTLSLVLEETTEK